jgi:AsmA protein
VTLGNLSLSLFSGSLVASDLSIADDPAYGTAPFLAAKQLHIGVEMGPLIFSRKLNVSSFEADGPQIHLVSGSNGSWNFSSIGKNAPSRTNDTKADSAFPDLSVGLISIRDGRAVVDSLPAQGASRVYEHLNLTINNFSFSKQFPFSLSASLPGDGTVAVDGKAGPINQQDAAMTALDAHVSIKHLDPVVAGFLDSSTGISMLADFDAHAVSNGTVLTSTGTVHAERLVILKGGSPAPKPVDLSYNVVHTLKDSSGQVQDLAVKTGSVAAHVTGTYQLPASGPVVDLKLVGQSLPIDELQSLLPAAGVKLPNGSVLKGGTLTTTLAITGPVKDSVISGPVELDNTRLAGFNLSSKVSGIAAMGGVQTGDVTVIQVLKMNLKVTNGGVQTDNVYAMLPALGEATGSGTVAPGGGLNYHLTVKVNTAQGIGKAGVGLLTAMNGMAGGAAGAVAKQGVPMTITGTTSNPVITANVKGLLKENVTSIKDTLLGGKGTKGNAAGVLSGLFGKKN